MNTEQIKLWLDYKDRLKNLETEVEAVKSKIADLEQPIMDEMLKAECSSMKIEGRTIYINTRVTASPLDKDALRLYFETNDMANLLTVNSQTLSSLVNEAWNEAKAEDALAPLPEPWASLVKVTEVQSLRARGK